MRDESLKDLTRLAWDFKNVQAGDINHDEVVDEFVRTWSGDLPFKILHRMRKLETVAAYAGLFRKLEELRHEENRGPFDHRELARVWNEMKAALDRLGELDT